MSKITQIILKYLFLFIFIIFIFLLAVFDIKELVHKSAHLLLLKDNIIYFNKAIKAFLPLIIIFILLYLWKNFITKKWVIKIEKLDIGGASIVFEKPEELFMQQIKNFLNTKRTLFAFNPNRDSIMDTFSSFFETYSFIKENMKIYDIKSASTSKYYSVANTMIQILNDFLTAHRVNYSRWFNNLIDVDYTEDICEIQKKYRYFDRLMDDFYELNTKFIEFGDIFKVDINKWINLKNNLNN